MPRAAAIATDSGRRMPTAAGTLGFRLILLDSISWLNWVSCTQLGRLSGGFVDKSDLHHPRPLRHGEDVGHLFIRRTPVGAQVKFRLRRGQLGEGRPEPLRAP